MQLLHALDQFVAAKRATGRAPTTISWYEIQLKCFLDWLPPEEASDLQPATIEAYYIHLAERLQPASVRGAHRALSAFLAWCKKRRLIATNPLLDVEPPHVPKRTRARTTPDDYRTLVDSIDGDDWVGLRDRLLIQTLFLSGIRVAELVALKLEDYDTRAKVLIIRRRKGGGDHTVPLLEPIAKALVAYTYNRPAYPTSEVFLASAGGGDRPDGVLTTNGVRHRLTALCRRAGIARLTPHKFRHGLARYMLDQGADMALIQRILGHERMSTTSEIYAVWDNLPAVASQYEQVMSQLRKR